MSERKLFPWCSTFLLFAFFLLTGLGVPAPVCAEETGSNAPLKWAVILSPGPRTGAPWGGYHITIAGYSEANGGQKKIILVQEYYKHTLFNGAPWHLHGTLPSLHDWNHTWTQTLESATLNRLANDLHKAGFERIKGPHHEAKTPWHISLLKDDKPKKRNDSKSLVREWETKKTDWYLWLVPMPAKGSKSPCAQSGIDCPEWTRID